MKYSYSYNANLSLAAVFNKNVIEIGVYYVQLIAELKLSQRLNADEKMGQLAFLSFLWEGELNTM